jgi:hypothetical protein
MRGASCSSWREPLDGKPLSADSRAHRATRVVSDVIERTAAVENRIDAGGSVPAVGVRGRQGSGARGVIAAGTEGTARVTCREWTEWARLVSRGPVSSTRGTRTWSISQIPAEVVSWRSIRRNNYVAKGEGKMKTLVALVTFSMALAPATHAFTADRYQIIPYGVFLRNPSVGSRSAYAALKVDESTGTMRYCFLDFYFSGGNASTNNQLCKASPVDQGSIPAGPVFLAPTTHFDPGSFPGIWKVDQATGLVTLCVTPTSSGYPPHWYCYDLRDF